MKIFIYASVILILLITIYLSVNFLFFDKWTLYQSENQLNNYVENHKDNNLKQISRDDKTYNFLRKKQKISIISKSDNQGSGSMNYYRVNINNNSAELYIKSKHTFIPEKTTIQHVRIL
ncbi:hypothetical protein BU063_04395 [Staphylococcus succinus]|uniref:hypothetical protein n=1 Tax=Staphylococcus succinus TaxID=61015 RepID=UPI000E698D31|nr:hypothetical protein [Staphylococcus succinus]MEB8127723.1 hypothetical protein [Staphylococcus succinus]RIN32386.1 hypothetical protein BU063_04395 [Staphylococcus succinus]